MTIAFAHSAVVRRTTVLVLVTDIGFILYWLVVASKILPANIMFNGYDDSAVAAWNWSFLPLDLCASIAGLTAVRSLRSGRSNALPLLIVSLTLTAAAGGMALAFWTVRGDFELAWWIPNAFLLLFPLPLLTRSRQTLCAN